MKVATQVKKEDKIFIPRTVMSQLRACHQLWVLACFPPSVLACLLACWRAGLLVARVLRPFLLACLLRACSPARLFFAPLAFGFKMVYIYVYIYIRLHPWRLKSQVGRHDDEEAAYFWGVRKGGGHECLACMWSMIWCRNFFK